MITSVQNSNRFIPIISRGQQQTKTSSSSLEVYYHSGYLPIHMRSKEVIKCYSCGRNFTNNVVFNLVTKHFDRRISGKNFNGHFIYNCHFTPAYYHPTLSHILRKNPYFDGELQVENSLYEKLGADNFVAFGTMSELEVFPVTG